MLKPLTCETIGNLDNGGAEKLINAAIKKAVDDLEDRGAEDKKERKVKIEIAFIYLNGMRLIGLKADTVIPPYVANSTHADARYKDETHTLLFQDKNAERVDQGTFPELDKLDKAGGEIQNE